MTVLTGEVGAGKTVCVRAALASLDPARYRPIYIPNPGIGTRGIYQQITLACGQAPRFHTGSLLPQTAAALATEAAEAEVMPDVGGGVVAGHGVQPGADRDALVECG